jgi:cellulose synthase/poly-beta-1,6-N-acetylglucosamine synthase-like glycosyltransferase/Tfp pilus assembly protein PilF/protein involved in temperature-dependent protein secretion
MVPSSFTRKFLIVFAYVVCIFYLAYRAIWTFNDTGPYALTASIALYAAECFGIFNLFLFFLQVWEVKEPPVQPVLEGRTVDVFVPTFNEDPALLRATLEACARMDYPHKTYVLDDGRRPEVEALARELGVHYISRADNRHFKAGNLNNAFERTDGEFVVVLDADHVPEPHFITRLIGYFRDDRLGYVQTPHAFYNFDSFQARLDHRNRKYWEEGHTFYYVIQPGRNHWGCPIFAGSAAMFRRTAIRDVGLMATETITEDMHTGLRMNAKGWKSLAISERLVAGQAAPDITTFHAQRMRWGTGNLSIMKYDNPLFVKGLTLPQRMCYLGSMLHWASGPFKLIIYLTPIAMLFSGIPPVKEFTWELLRITLLYLIVSLTTMKIVSNGYGSIINSELFSMVNFWTQIKSTLRAIFGYGSRTFNVTPKGAAAQAEQKKRGVWPFIRPQTYLIILSVLALFWGWSRPVLGISDDWFKPVVPTVWVLLFFWLAYKVTQRAFWPADRRITTRHPVNVPVEYETMSDAAAPRYGVTVDLNDTGMALVAYERFAAGDILRVTVRGAGEVVRCKGEVRTVTDLTRGQVADGFRYGIQFQNLTPLQVDSLNRVCLHYGVPRMYGEFDKQRGGILGGIQKRLDRGMAQRRSEFRNEYRLPIVVNSGDREDTAQFSATEDLSRSAVAAMLENELPKNSLVGYLIASPLGEVRGTAKVLRSTREIFGGRTYFRTVFEFTDYEGQGRTTLHSLVNPNEAGPLKSVLKPERKPIIVQMAGATLVAVLIAIPLILLQSGLFHVYHSDDRILRDITIKAKNKEQLTTADAENVERILHATLQDKNPTSDRLVLLMGALKVYDRRGDQLKVAEKLASRNENDLTLQQTLIYAQMDAQRYEEAERTYVRLRDNKSKGDKLNADQQWLLELSGARVAEGRGDMPVAIERYRKLFQQQPEFVPPNELPVTPLRREFAGVLLKAGSQDPAHYDEAKQVLQGAKPDDIASRKMLAAAYLLKGRSASTDPKISNVMRPEVEASEYNGAETVATALAAYGEQKNDPAIKEEAERMRADIQMARKSWTSAQQIMQKLLEPYNGDINRADPDVVRRIAQVQLGIGDNVGALDAFMAILDNQRVSGDLKTEVIKGYLDAAYSDKVKTHHLGDRGKRITRGIYDTSLASIDRDPIYLARLGWVLQKVGEPEAGKLVLEKAIEQQPNNPVTLNELAVTLINSKNYREAAKVLERTDTFNAKMALSGILMTERDYPAAENELRKLLQKYRVGSPHPDGKLVTAQEYKKAEIMLGSVLTSIAIKRSGDTIDPIGVAVSYWQSLDRRHPNDSEVLTGIGNTYLWSVSPTSTKTDKDAAYTNALKQYQRAIVAKTFAVDQDSFATQGKVEAAFLDAAANAPILEPAEVATARGIAARSLASPSADAKSVQLAWVLIKSNDSEARKDALALLKRSSDANPTKDDERRELANVLAAAREFKLAAEILAPLKRTVADSVKMADLYSGGREWDLAKTELNNIIADPSATPEQKKTAQRDLVKVTGWSGDFTGALTLAEDVVKQDPNDIEMKIFQAEVNVWMKKMDRALELYSALFKQYPENLTVQTGFTNAAAKSTSALSPDALTQLARVIDRASSLENKDALLVARAAEAQATKLGDPVKARQLALKAAAMDPKDPIVRREVAYVLSHPKVGLYKEADALFIGLELAGDDLKQYVFIASQAENYEAARKAARLYLAEQKLPGSPAHRAARKLLADVLTWKGDYEEALAIYNQLAEGQKLDSDLRTDIAQVYRYWQNYPMALTKFADLLREDIARKDLWIGFIDAASSAPKIEHEKALLLQIHNRYADEVQDPRALSRMAWVMHRLEEPAKAHPLLTRAVAANPQQAAVRKELAGVLAAVGRRAEAINMLMLPDILAGMDITELLNLADLLTAENQIDRAEKELARVVTEASDRKSRVRYGSVLLWNEKYPKAQEIFTRLLADYPGDREILLYLAQSYLWAKDYTNALRRFSDLVLTGDPKQDPLANPEIWRGFVDAAAGAAGESLRDFPRRTIGPLFANPQQAAIFRAYGLLTTVRDKTIAENKTEMNKLTAPGAEKDPSFETRKSALQSKNEGRIRSLAATMGRLGLLTGLLGKREMSDGAFGAALALDRNNRDVWLQRAQTLMALGDDVEAKKIFDWLLTNPAQKLPPPSEISPK